MPTRERRYPKEEFARRGDAIYEAKVRPRLKPEEDGAFVAIDIETEDFEVGRDQMAVCERLRERTPDAQIWLMRAGRSFLTRFGGHGLRSRP